MSSTESEDYIKNIDRRPEPLCLFCYPYDATDGTGEETYLRRDGVENVTSAKPKRTKWPARKEKQEIWLRRRTEVRRKKRMMEAGRHLKSFLFTSVRPGRDQQKVYIPCLIQALETVKDAWPPKKGLSIERFLDGKESPGENRESFAMKEDNLSRLLFSSRRSSMPEDVMRKYFLKKIIPSEESETNLTYPDIVSTSSKESPKKKDSETNSNDLEFLSRKREVGSLTIVNTDKTPKKDSNLTASNADACEKKIGTGLKRVIQNDYDKQGKGIIRQKTKERGSQTGRFSGRSETSPTAREDTEDSRTSESLPSSSPVELPRHPTGDISTSGNLSSESEDVKCTCAELTSSKDTSTDLFRSGNSTLSQTVSEKSVSTQDSTVSIHSISTGGSTTGASSNSNSTSPDMFGRTSAKESSSDRSPRRRHRGGPTMQGRRRFLRQCPRFLRRKPFCRKHFRSRRREVHYDISEEKEPCDDDCSTEEPKNTTTRPLSKIDEEKTATANQDGNEDTKYKWAKYTPEEIYMMQQMRHRKFIENYRRYSIPLPATPDTGSLSACAASGSVYKQIEELDDRVLIPRYSALPRTLSMLVNTSSGDTSGLNSDSDSLSLADSLEEYPLVHVHQYDTKKERKPVRGDVNAAPEKKVKIKRTHPRPKAFFVSFKEPFGEDELLSGISKLPEPPEKIKERINERQLNILRLQKQNMEKRLESREKKKQKKFVKDLRSLWGKERGNDITDDGALIWKDRKQRNMPKRFEKKQDQESSSSKIRRPSTSTSTSPERESKVHRKKKIRKDKAKPDTIHTGCTTQDLNNPKHSEKEDVRRKGSCAEKEEVKNKEATNSAKPQAVIHPSQMPISEPDLYRWTKQLNIPQSRSGKFRQKFEVIPEEKSSSLSSTDERKPEETNISQSESNFYNHNPAKASNLIFAKIKSSSMQKQSSVPKGLGKDHPIILVSPKSGTNSRRGRDALIAMNREDFNRLSKGWMNFYMLKETNDASEYGIQDEQSKSHSEKRDKPNLRSRRMVQDENRPIPNVSSEADVKSSEFTLTEKADYDLMSMNVPQVERKESVELEKNEFKELKKTLNETLRFHSSNTILKPISVTPKKPEKSLSLPELIIPSSSSCTVDQQSKNKNSTIVLPKVSQKFEDNEVDSDSTVYCQPPSLIVPRLVFDVSGDSRSGDSLSDSEGEIVENKQATFPNKHIPLRKRGVSNRIRCKRDAHLESMNNGNDYSGWSVTVAGPLDLTSATPDLEMRLSFPANSVGPPQASQSDSGFTEEGPHSREQYVPDGNVKQRWTVTVKNPRKGDADGLKRKMDKNHTLPSLGHTQSQNMKKTVKSHSLLERNMIATGGEISIYWPKIELTGGELVEEANDEELSVRGSAISMEKKPRPPTMTEKDLIRGLTARSQSDCRSSKKCLPQQL
ncbi:UNVERIFIED_CONTAM: hypothetical protein PYX00_004031 [Menopon gallinae]|uniref:Uncharacterized protein n=1 Tax=Menopon gallinae TaxID=328185 RepID=A0AAW2I2P0_9NEOP